MANIKISELNGITKKANDDVLAIVDISADETKKIAVEDLLDKNVELIAVTDTEPAECSYGDKYFNTIDNLIYTAIATDTWGEDGEEPISGILYIVYADQASYSWNGTELISVGGGKEDIVISDTEPTGDDWKLWIDSDKQADNTYYNDNGTPTNIKTTTFDTLPVGAEVDYDGETVPTGWTEVDDTTTGNFTLNSNVASGDVKYVKIGKFIQVQANFILNSSAIPSGTWKTISIGTVPSGLEPKIQTNILARRDTGGQIYIFNIETTGEITMKDRGTGNLQGTESIVCNGFYIIA